MKTPQLGSDTRNLYAAVRLSGDALEADYHFPVMSKHHIFATKPQKTPKHQWYVMCPYLRNPDSGCRFGC